jgi:hypothetical protein
MTAPATEYRELSLGELVGRIGDDSATLLRQEIALARAEMTEKAVAAGTGIGLGVVALVVVLGAFGAGVTAAIAGLSIALPLWAAALVTLGGLMVVAALLGLTAALRLKSAAPPIPTEAIKIGKETPHELLN